MKKVVVSNSEVLIYEMYGDDKFKYIQYGCKISNSQELKLLLKRFLDKDFTKIGLNEKDILLEINTLLIL